MVAVTYGVARVAAPAVADTKAGKRSKSFFARVFDAIADSQMKRAERELARHRHLLPHDFELTARFVVADWRQVAVWRLVIVSFSPAKPPRRSPPGAVLFRA